MGRPKRKSEGDLLPSRKKVRKTADKSDASESSHAEDEASEELFVSGKLSKARHVKRPTLNSRKSEPVKRLVQSDDAEEEVGLGSQEFIQIVAKKAKDKNAALKSEAEFREKFASAVEGDEKALKKQIETLSKESAKRNSDFLDTFTEAFMASRPKPPPSKDSTRGKSTPATMIFASLYERSRQLASNASTIIAKFEAVEEMTIKIELSNVINVETWEKATTRTQGVVDLGRKVGIDRYEKMLSGDNRPLEFEGEDDGETAEMFYASEKYTGSAGWLPIAKKSEKYSRRLLKALPQIALPQIALPVKVSR